jgi:O-antigen ligase
MGLALCGFLAWSRLDRRFDLSVKAFIFLIGMVALIQLIPLPPKTIGGIEAFKYYTNGIGLVDPVNLKIWRPLSLDPRLSLSSLLNLIAPISLFLFISQQERDKLINISICMIAVATLEAVYSLTQIASGTLSATGTFNYRNAFAAYLVMSLSLGVGLAAGLLGRAKGNLSNLLYVGVSFRFVIILICLLVLPLAIIFTQSRMGMITAGCLIVSSLLIFGWKADAKKIWVTFVAAASSISILAISIGVVPSLNRFVEQDAAQDLRWPIFKATITGIEALLPFGSGFGTFSEVFLRFQTDPVLAGVFINHAHNEYLEWIFEGGILSILVITLFFLLYLNGWLRLLKYPGTSRSLKYLKVGAGLGILMLMTHCLVDYNLHIPANQISLAVLLGLFFNRDRN